MFMGNILHKDLSFTLNGILFNVHNNTGRFASEKQVCDLIEESLKENSIKYRREFILPTEKLIENPGRHRVDFLIEDCIILEIKYKQYLEREDYAQIKRYLKTLNLALGILVNFREKRLYPKRILNGSGKE